MKPDEDMQGDLRYVVIVVDCEVDLTWFDNEVDAMDHAAMAARAHPSCTAYVCKQIGAFDADALKMLDEELVKGGAA